MEKIKVEYAGGQSRWGNGSVDYMLARLDDGRELYAETPPGEKSATYDTLWMMMLLQASAQGLAAGQLEFPY